MLVFLTNTISFSTCKQKSININWCIWYKF